MRTKIGHSIASLLIALSFSVQGQEAAPTKVQYLKIQVSREKLNQTWILLGQVKDGKIQLLNENFELRTVDPKNQPQSSSVLTPSGPAKPIDLNTPSLNYVMSETQTKQCENLREFKTFLSQLSVFQGLFYDMEVTASSREQAACVSKITDQIISKGYKVSVAFGDLPQGGIQVRAYLTGRGAPVELARGGYEGDVRITVHMGYSRKTFVPVLKDGFFILSFDAPPLPLRVAFELKGNPIHEEPVHALPMMILGVQQKQLFGTKSGTVTKAYMDNLSIEDIPTEILDRAVQERLAQQEKYRWSIRNNVLVRTIKGSGLITSPMNQIIPLSMEAFYSVTDRFNLKVDLTPEFAFGDDGAPKSNYLAAGLLYWIHGHENRHFLERSKIRYGMGLQGYYLQNRAKAATASSAFLLTDLMGVALINRVSFQPSSKFSFNAGYDLMPFPETASNRSSLSTRQLAEVEYCMTYEDCFSVGYHLQSFELDYITIGKLKFETQDWTLGYRMSFE